MTSGKEPIERLTRGSDEEEDQMRLIRDRNCRTNAENKVEALKRSCQALNTDLDTEIEQIASMEKALSVKDSHLAALEQKIGQMKDSHENKLRKRESENKNAREQLQLMRKQ
jgi:hypothetical protein